MSKAFFSSPVEHIRTRIFRQAVIVTTIGRTGDHDHFQGLVHAAGPCIFAVGLAERRARGNRSTIIFQAPCAEPVRPISFVGRENRSKRNRHDVRGYIFNF